MRNRLLIILLLFLVIVLGLASRKYPGLFPQALGKYPGDALWCMAVYLALAFAWPTISPLKLLIFSLCIATAVEVSQLYQAPWLNQIRENSLGHLFLGSTFGWWDLLAYTLGAIIMYLLHTWGKRLWRVN